MTTPSEPSEFEPVPIRVSLPEGQEIVGRLYARRQLPDSWVYLVPIPVYRNADDGGVEAAEYRMWLRPQDHLHPVEGTSYEAVPTERLPAPSLVERILGPRRPSGWVLEDLGGRTGRSQAVVHAVDCTEAPRGAPRLSLDQALAAAERPGVRLCSLCGASQELDPVLRGFDAGFEGDDL
ncbi:DUF6233 domain-containing protein [Streptomyces sp. NBC_00233]|uniref:DUF6233 domain-containing protein n=1 Tax=Streptomyces sp. NBC_00233 TaxID=2975686 RepID=UPI00224D5CCE|nr:DUF6233 domain-containing protein [Streptomyces sp. NBC_00233]MCX5233436.1 DUF6233 domain-containing protein [Streptomyces sp. NBC_00233]